MIELITVRARAAVLSPGFARLPTRSHSAAISNAALPSRVFVLRSIRLPEESVMHAIREGLRGCLRRPATSDSR